jgi:hypothetical protein
MEGQDMDSHPTTRRRRRKISPIARLLRLSKAKLLLAVTALLTVASLAVAGSWAAWTVSDSNNSNSFTTGTVLLADNNGGEAGTATNTGTAMFSVTGMAPGDVQTRCIGVKVISGTPSAMTLAASLAGANSATLGPVFQMTTATWEAGTTGTVAGQDDNGANNTVNSNGCSGYTPSSPNSIGTQGATLTSWVNGGTPYSTSTTQTDAFYKFAVTFPSGSNNCNSYCNKVITISLTWQVTAT